MFKLAVKAVLAFAMIMSVPACATDPQDAAAEPETSVTAQALESPEAMLVFENKHFFQTWANFCEDLSGLEIRTTVNGCTTSTTYTNCRRGVIDGTCKCDVTVQRSGSC